MRCNAVLAILSLAGVLALGGCASSGSGRAVADGGTEGNSTLIVDGIPAVGSLSIYMMGDIPGQRLVGFVRAGTSTRLRFNLETAGSYQFIVESLTGESGATNLLRLYPGVTVHWNLSSNLATVSEP